MLTLDYDTGKANSGERTGAENGDSCAWCGTTDDLQDVSDGTVMCADCWDARCEGGRY